MQNNGMYRSDFEHDACGIGFIADINNQPSHETIIDGLHMLSRLNHRAGQNDDTGDGAGILVQIPDQFFRDHLPCHLPQAGDYAVGMVFMPQEQRLRETYETEINQIIKKSSLTLIEWRDVPVNNERISRKANEDCPSIKQVFVKKAFGMDQKQFERALYIIRRSVEKRCSDLYFCSFSSRTIVYKGMIKPERLKDFYLDLSHPSFASALALVHSRFSTNTFPTWERAHPNRSTVHNGEINTLRGNINWMKAREQQMSTDVFGDDLSELHPVIDNEGSDSAVFDNVLEFLTLSGRPMPHAALMMVPEPWERSDDVDPLMKNFYEYHSAFMEPWDGPMALAFTDGQQIGALLDRNGLRPGRYYLTNNDKIIFSSEFGVVDVPQSEVKTKGRIKPGELLVIDLEEKRIIPDTEYKQNLSTEQPYGAWLSQEKMTVDHEHEQEPDITPEELFKLQTAFGYTYEELMKGLKPMVTDSKDPLSSMGVDTPLAVLSEKPQLLYNYFKQWFAQVTNPPIDAIREESMTATLTWMGPQGNILQPEADHCRRVQLQQPVIGYDQIQQIAGLLKTDTVSLNFETDASIDYKDLMDRLFTQVDDCLEAGAEVLVLSDRGVNTNHAAIPALLASSAVHHYLIRQGIRTKVSLIIETAEARDVHQMAMLLGFGADAMYPYLGVATLHQLIDDGHIEGVSKADATQTYFSTLTTGIVKVMSKMGISTIQSYRGAQTFEAVGIGQDVIERYFTGTVSQLDGISLEDIFSDALRRHQQAFDDSAEATLDSGSDMQWRRGGEHHQLNPKTIHTLQQAARKNDYELYKQFSELANQESLVNIRDLLTLNSNRQPVPIDEVEPVEAITRRFKSGAMSYGALSQEAHEALAIAMNIIGGKSNSGEGGEDPERYELDDDGLDRKSAIKQVASGRFGVSSHYLSNANEIQIKMAQGAKPGEGGQLPSHKVYPWIAEVRGTTPGVGLISPPPHHDIYSIEDLAQLIHDLKRANPKARISVKLVAKSGVGTIAAGVAKGLADVILISGHDGGSGASPRSSIKHAGLPWELGLAETQQTLVLNGLRDRVTIETDGKMMTGRDVLIAASLGAEEYGFSTTPLIALGCVMMRACHLDTCPVGVATQNPELRKRMMGKPEHVVNYLQFIAQEIRELLAELGFRTLDELIGDTSVLAKKSKLDSHSKAKHLNLDPLLQPVDANLERRFAREQDHQLEHSFDYRHLLPDFQGLIAEQQPMMRHYEINNTDRAVGTVLGHHISSEHGADGLPEDTFQMSFTGSAGQSFAAFVPQGMSMSVDGDANDYLGKGLSGGKVMIRPDMNMHKPDDQVIAGNVAFFGATSGEAYIRGRAGERFCVRNSGAHAVVEGVGNHGCEYMTGGTVLVLGDIGKNFAAGMTGGQAYIIPDITDHDMADRINREMVAIETGLTDDEDAEIKAMLEEHLLYTGSPKARQMLSRWNKIKSMVLKVIPKDYQNMLRAITALKQSGLTHDEAILEAFNRKQAGNPLPQNETDSYETVS
ncbi:glutamate synthase large subunit [Tuberibacillus sp. Marseille-P3662]|uniref:glutamate synthase large subunit n=1 Tax=Tuberibacillus sp. Marseille-P3662 TaxID=1965358 RepID=UPI000A1CC5FB|nr:glutamate synthase large subunit [Tuberibacillus sp. Marseille-P3662]